MTKMKICNLSSSMTVESMNRIFSEFGTVRSISLSTDIMTGRCSGFGYVHLDEEQIGVALSALNGKRLDDRALNVTLEQKQEYPYSRSRMEKKKEHSEAV